ncbi:MAG: hypothetical protein WBD99_09665 [Thermodesulfobacteriota bacterium]
MNNNSDQIKELVLQGLCIKCFYLTFSEDRERLNCDKYKITLEGIVESCGGYISISEGLEELIIRMKANGELREWIDR